MKIGDKLTLRYGTSGIPRETKLCRVPDVFMQQILAGMA
jgi:hypothetical protein